MKKQLLALFGFILIFIFPLVLRAQLNFTKKWTVPRIATDGGYDIVHFSEIEGSQLYEILYAKIIHQAVIKNGERIVDGKVHVDIPIAGSNQLRDYIVTGAESFLLLIRQVLDREGTVKNVTYKGIAFRKLEANLDYYANFDGSSRFPIKQDIYSFSKDAANSRRATANVVEYVYQKGIFNAFLEEPLLEEMSVGEQFSHIFNAKAAFGISDDDQIMGHIQTIADTSYTLTKRMNKGKTGYLFRIYTSTNRKNYQFVDSLYFPTSMHYGKMTNVYDQYGNVKGLHFLFAKDVSKKDTAGAGLMCYYMKKHKFVRQWTFKFGKSVPGSFWPIAVVEQNDSLLFLGDSYDRGIHCKLFSHFIGDRFELKYPMTEEEKGEKPLRSYLNPYKLKNDLLFYKHEFVAFYRVGGQSWFILQGHIQGRNLTTGLDEDYYNSINFFKLEGTKPTEEIRIVSDNKSPEPIVFTELKRADTLFCGIAGMEKKLLIRIKNGIVEALPIELKNASLLFDPNKKVLFVTVGEHHIFLQKENNSDEISAISF